MLVRVRGFGLSWSWYGETLTTASKNMRYTVCRQVPDHPGTTSCAGPDTGPPCTVLLCRNHGITVDSLRSHTSAMKGPILAPSRAFRCELMYLWPIVRLESSTEIPQGFLPWLCSFGVAWHTGRESCRTCCAIKPAPKRLV